MSTEGISGGLKHVQHIKLGSEVTAHRCAVQNVIDLSRLGQATEVHFRLHMSHRH